jgi:hypothetical protein
MRPSQNGLSIATDRECSDRFPPPQMEYDGVPKYRVPIAIVFSRLTIQPQLTRNSYKKGERVARPRRYRNSHLTKTSVLPTQRGMSAMPKKQTYQPNEA